MCNVKHIVKPEANLVVCEIREDYDTRFRGIGKCNPTDTFNEETGKKCLFAQQHQTQEYAFMRYQGGVLTSKSTGSMTRNTQKSKSRMHCFNLQVQR